MATQPTQTLDQLLQDMLNANKSLAGSIGNQQQFSDVLKNAISSKFGGNEDLIKQQAEQAQAYFTAPSQAREKYQDIFDPFARERLAAEYAGQQGQGLDVASELLKERRGSQADILQAGRGAFESYLQGQQAAASGAQQAYQTAYQKRQDELQQGLGRLETIISSGAIATMGEKALKLLAQSTGYTYGQLIKIRDRIKRQLAQQEQLNKLQQVYKQAQTSRQQQLAGGGGRGGGRRSSGLTPYQQLQQQNRQQRSETQQEQAFKNSVTSGLKQLQSGVPWGPVWNAIKAQYPNVPNNVIDQFLQADYWRRAGAYQNYIATQQSAKR